MVICLARVLNNALFVAGYGNMERKYNSDSSQCVSTLHFDFPHHSYVKETKKQVLFLYTRSILLFVFPI